MDPENTDNTTNNCTGKSVINNSDTLNSQNYTELFSNKISWFVDDTNVYRVTINKGINDELTTKPINGVLLVFNPKTGLVFMKVTHKSVWEGKKKLGQLAKTLSCEEVSALIKSLPKEEQPEEIILIRRGLFEPLQKQLKEDCNDFKLRTTDLNIRFQSFIRLNKFDEVISNATQSQLILFNMYDDWLSSISSFTCFSRLVLLLNGFLINSEKVKEILKPKDTTETKQNHIWPCISNEMWINVEEKIKDLILNDYEQLMKVNVSNLSQIEIRDIILGVKIEKEDK